MGICALLLYVKLIQCSGFPQIYCSIRRKQEWSQSTMGISTFCYICETYMVQWYSSRCMLDLDRWGDEFSLPWVNLHFAIYEIFQCRGVA